MIAAATLLLGITFPAQEGKPDNAALFAKYSEAQRKHLAGERDVALAAMKEVLDADPKNAELALSIARWLAQEREDFAGGEPFARRATGLEPRSAEAANLLGACLISTGRFGESESVYRSAIARFPNDAVMHYGLGMSCGQQMKYLEARAHYAKSIELDPNCGLYHFSNGECLSNLREWELSEQQFRLAVKLNGHADALWRLGEVLVRTGKDAEAEKTLTQALTTGPKLSRFSAALQLGIFFFERARHADSAAILHQATKHRPEGRDAWLWLARAERALGHEDASERALKKYQELRTREDRIEEERLLGLIKAQLEGKAASKEPGH